MTFSLHAEALAWLRYSKKMPIVVTESGMNADVLGISGDLVLEVEVKTSVSDARAEFRNKVHKHSIFRQMWEQGGGRTTYCPNFWYMFVDEGIAPKVLELVEEHAPYAGVMVRRYPARYEYGAGKMNIVSARRARKIHPNPPRPMFARTAIMRQSSEICGWHMLADHKWGVPGQDLARIILQRLEMVEGRLDHEDGDKNLDQRGAELALVMTGKPWSSLSSKEKLSWCMKAQMLLNIRRGPVLEIPREEIT
jgi:hypothetical protein